MESRVSFAVVGAFVLLLGAALVAGVLWLSSGGTYGKSYETYLVYTNESVSGLSTDADVRYRGVQVGRVSRIELANSEQVRLTLDIEEGTPIKQDTIAVLRTQGLTGVAYVELTGGSAASPPLKAQPGEKYPVIASGPSLLTRLDTAVTELLHNVNALLDEQNRKEFAQTLANLEAITESLSQRSQAIDAVLANTSKTMENAARVSAELSTLIEQVKRAAASVEGMSQEVSKASTDVAQSVEGAGADVHRFTGETLPQARALLEELRALSASLRHLSGELERNPAVLLRGRPAPKPGPGE